MAFYEREQLFSLLLKPDSKLKGSSENGLKVTKKKASLESKHMGVRTSNDITLETCLASMRHNVSRRSKPFVCYMKEKNLLVSEAPAQFFFACSVNGLCWFFQFPRVGLSFLLTHGTWRRRWELPFPVHT